MRSCISFFTALFAVFIIALYSDYNIQSSTDSLKNHQVPLFSLASFDFDYPASMLSLNAGRSVSTLSTRPVNHRNKHIKFFAVSHLVHPMAIVNIERENRSPICDKNDLFAQPNLNLRLQVIRI